MESKISNFEKNIELGERKERELIYNVLHKLSKKMRIKSSTTLRNTNRKLKQNKGGNANGLIRAAVWEQACGMLEKEMEAWE